MNAKNFIVWMVLLFGHSSQVAATIEAHSLLRKCLENPLRRQEAELALELLTSFPSPVFLPLYDQNDSNRALPTSYFYALHLGTDPAATLLNSTDELRFLPYALTGTSILLVLKEAANWDEVKGSKVAAVARAKSHRLSLIWLTHQPIPPGLAALIQGTGGKLWTMKDLQILTLRRACSR